MDFSSDLLARSMIKRVILQLIATEVDEFC